MECKPHHSTAIAMHCIPFPNGITIIISQCKTHLYCQTPVCGILMICACHISLPLPHLSLLFLHSVRFCINPFVTVILPFNFLFSFLVSCYTIFFFCFQPPPLSLWSPCYRVLYPFASWVFNFKRRTICIMNNCIWTPLHISCHFFWLHIYY